MSTITKERVAEIIHASGLEPCDYEAVFDSIKTGEIVSIARIALASLEADAVAWMWERDGNRDVDMDNPNEGVNRIGAKKAMDAGWKCSPLYSAPPAQVSVPDEVTTEDCPAFVKYDVTDVDEAWARGYNACRDAMLQGGKP